MAIRSAPVMTMLTVLLAIFLLWAWARGRPGLWGTTLQQPWCWLLAAIIFLAIGQLASDLGWISFRSNRGQACGYCIATSTYCPVMGLLGAKRPQHRAWQWIVLTFWIVLSVPAVEFVLYQRGGWLRLPAAWRILLMVFTVLPVANYLPTRLALPSAAYVIGQLWLVGPLLRNAEQTMIGAPLGALGGAALAFGLARWGGYGSRDAPVPPMSTDGQLWQAFRNYWGVLWTMRVAERFNAQCAAQGTVRLGWHGFHPRKESATSAIASRATPSPSGEDSEGAAAAPSPAESDVFRALLRRFVSDRWMVLDQPATRDLP